MSALFNPPKPAAVVQTELPTPATMASPEATAASGISRAAAAAGSSASGSGGGTGVWGQPKTTNKGLIGQ